MRVFVQMWTEIDPTLNLRIDRQTGQPAVDEGDVLTRVSPLARYGLTEALKLQQWEVTAFALGEDHDEALRHALASGAKRAVRVALSPAPARGAEELLTNWLGAEMPDLVIADRMAGFVAARLGWAHLAGLDRLQANGRMMTAVRVFGRGAYEEVAATFPAVVRLQTDSPRPQYIARARLNRAAMLPIEATRPVVAGLEIGAPLRGVRYLGRPEDAAVTDGPESRPYQGQQSDTETAGRAAKVEAGPLQLARPRTRLAPPTAAPAKAADRLNALMGLGERATAPPAKPRAAPARSTQDMAQEFARFLRHHQLLPGA